MQVRCENSHAIEVVRSIIEEVSSPESYGY